MEPCHPNPRAGQLVSAIQNGAGGLRHRRSSFLLAVATATTRRFSYYCTRKPPARGLLYFFNSLPRAEQTP